MPRTKTFTKEQLDEYKKIFQLFDKNGNGKISIDELGQVMKQMGQAPSQKELEQMIKAADFDGSGCIEFQEFVKVMSITFDDEPLDEAELRDAFKVFDSDNSGTITSAELKQVVAKLGLPMTEADINEMIRVADSNGDGHINYKEFVSMMLKK